MKFETNRWGELEVDDEQLVHFDQGLPGFPDCHRFFVLEHDRDTPLKWLQCVDDGEVAFLVIEPEQLLGQFSVDVPQVALDQLEFESAPKPKEIGVFLILHAQEDGLFANLRAPVIVNMERRKALQLILEDANLPLRYEVKPPAA